MKTTPYLLPIPEPFKNGKRKNFTETLHRNKKMLCAISLRKAVMSTEKCEPL